ncbi:MAG TPA: DUF1501 domain-containing protein [Verrucomicrobiota bacterium]|nr:DUF1501 domain-containing protein [Verrucomicrobiota bacterium]HNU53318.1 DUF1501 domain-containing protein [Verrucomicrobiota bacterium]
MRHFSRRSFCHTGAVLLGGLRFGALPGLFQRQLLAGNAPENRKLLFIFQTGGNDGVNTLIPRGDSNYNSTTRPTLFISGTEAIDTGNGFAQFHPRLQPMTEVYNHSRLNGIDGPGNLAVLHRIGYAGQSQSHFDSQQYWQNGVPGNPDLEEGVFYRHLASTLDLSRQDNAFVAAALSSAQLVALKGASPVPNFTRAAQLNVTGSASRAAKYLGHLPTRPGGADGTGLMGLYGGSPDSPIKPYRDLVHSTGRLLGTTIQTLQDALARGAYTPENGAVYPNTEFGARLREAAMLFKRTPVRIIGTTIGGWDTHTNQGTANGTHGNLLNSLALGFHALHRDLQSQWDQLLIITLTEFGRTSEENGSGGTDHADSSVMFAAGGRVLGGIYNCDATTWKTGDLFSKSGRYLSRRTDFRAVFGEVFTRHFGDPVPLLDRLMPGYSQAAAANPTTFQPLGFLPA